MLYGRKPRACAFLALGWYALLLSSMAALAVLEIGMGPLYHALYVGLSLLPLFYVLLREKSAVAIGFSGENLKMDCLIGLGIIAACILIAVVKGSLSAADLVIKCLYYLLYVAVLEELVYRGFVQSYLLGFFGHGLSERMCFVVGGLLFAIGHIPVPVYFSGVGLAYILMVLPQLLFAFLFHIAMCALADKRDSVLLPIAIHFAADFLYKAVF